LAQDDAGGKADIALSTLNDYGKLADKLAKLHDLHARGIPISSDLAFFHFGGGMAVRNLCRERLSDHELAAFVPFGGDWDNCYIGVLTAIGARRQ